MTLPTIDKLYDVCEATWPCASQREIGGFIVRDGKGGGKRVSAATLNAPLARANYDEAEAAMDALGQSRLFQIREGEGALDQILIGRGYSVIDPVNVYAIAAKDLAIETPPRTVAIPTWEPLAIMEELWSEGGVAQERIEVMLRAAYPKTGLLSRWNDKPAGTSFVSMHDGVSMIHALEITPRQRRNGLGRWAMIRTGFWTLENGGETVSVICTQTNTAANKLYQSLGMQNIGSYHYRIKA
ncbi:GNAT family N-acetyltransferase [Cognatishimia activa]|uniref:Putative acetyltransferase n=1 Tax=Cognatishimia activa TaxID=1715691 RepID=A0A0P1IME8_9RHOB|nr:GNAT family N-acetyltransferase [Cognatishimia activa]CUI35570.1 putative acetyltransferase [Cognatishimia activa]CUK24716.1 putative acetyltransferase [Cognatishimia activa]